MKVWRNGNKLLKIIQASIFMTQIARIAQMYNYKKMMFYYYLKPS